VLITWMNPAIVTVKLGIILELGTPIRIGILGLLQLALPDPDEAVLNLKWFSAAVRTTLAGAGYDGWGTAATASSAALGGLFFLLVAVVAVVAYSIAGSRNHALISGLNDFVWAGFVLTSFPRAMLIMSSAFGLWRARQIANARFAAGVAAVVLVLLDVTNWLSGGLWAPDGVYSRFVSPPSAWCGAWS